MNDERLRCAEAALRQVPEGYRKVDATDVADQERGHSFHHGMHIGWAWGENERGRTYLDFLSEHRHPGIQAVRYFTDGRSEPIATPSSMRAVSPDPAEDAEFERAFFERNRAAYTDLRVRGLLPPEGENVGSQDINAYLLKGGVPTSGGNPDAAVGADELPLGGGWDEVLRDELNKPYWPKLLEFITDEYENYDVYPPRTRTFKAFKSTPYDDVRLVILGQDPYPTPGDADGLAFSVSNPVSKTPVTLKNIFAELKADVGTPTPASNSLEGWANQGVLLLNTALTLRAGSKADRKLHRRWRWNRQGWTTFTDAVISAIADKDERVVFILWGNDARRKAKLIDVTRHDIIEGVHPSPLSAYKGFFGSKPFSRANSLLVAARCDPIDWAQTS